MDETWAYLNDLEGCDVLAIYHLHSLIEIVYRKENKSKSLTINFHVTGGSMGYIESFEFDSIPLPPAKLKHPLSDAVATLSVCHLYSSDNGWDHYEELELVSSTGRFLLFFDAQDTKECFARLEQGKVPSLFMQTKQEAALPKELFSVNLFKENLAFALRAHGEQKTPHGLPYSMHLLSVAAEVMNALSVEPLSYDEHNVALACALLHDVNEDTSTKITQNSDIAGNREVIAKGVAALTKDKTLSSKEAQMSNSIARLKKRQNCVALVKLADRITNLGVPPQQWNTLKKRAYVNEAKCILEELGYAHHYLASKLQHSIVAYEDYM